MIFVLPLISSQSEEQEKIQTPLKTGNCQLHARLPELVTKKQETNSSFLSLQLQKEDQTKQDSTGKK